MSDSNENIYLRRSPKHLRTTFDQNNIIVATKGSAAPPWHIKLDKLQVISLLLGVLLLSSMTIWATLSLTQLKTDHLSDDACKIACAEQSQRSYGMVELQQASLTEWLAQTNKKYYGRKKAQALLLSASQSDNLLLGLFEQYQRDEKIEAAFHYLMAGLGGYEKANDLLKGLSLTTQQVGRLKETFVKYHTRNGGRGFLRLGQLYLDESYEKSGPIAVADQYYVLYGYYLPARSDSEAFVQFQMAALCGYGEAYDWLTYMAKRDGFSPPYRDQLSREAEEKLQKIVADSKQVRATFCAGAARPNEPLEDRVGGLVLGIDDASRAYRDNPGSAAVDDSGGIPPNCITNNSPPNCVDRKQFLTCADESRYWFNRGEAEMAIGQTTQARAFFSEAIKVGRKCGAESAVLASKRLGALNLTCEYSAQSLARISRDARQNPDGGDIIDLPIRQKALKALGHYQGNIDSKYGPMTRRAISDFQRELGFQETGDLSPLETVYLICSAADNARDRDAKNVLGIMYVTGLGVVQNTDTGLLWLKDAADSGDVDALYNLAIIYGSGTVLSSYRLCDVVESTERADAYLQEAVEANHPFAKELVKKYGPLSSQERWQRIKNEQLEQVDFYNKRLKNVGEGCDPN